MMCQLQDAPFIKYIVSRHSLISDLSGNLSIHYNSQWKKKSLFFIKVILIWSWNMMISNYQLQLNYLPYPHKFWIEINLDPGLVSTKGFALIWQGSMLENFIILSYRPTSSFAHTNWIPDLPPLHIGVAMREINMAVPYFLN